MNYNFADRMGNLKASAIREILKFTADKSVISFAAGNPSPEAFPIDEVTKITASLFKTNPIGMLQYSITEGHMPLRELLKKQLKSGYNIGNSDDDLVIVSGAQQGIELAVKSFCNKGDTIVCESPSFIGSLNAFKSYEANLIGVEMESDGIDVNKLSDVLQNNKTVKLLYLIPNFQNPSGITMSFAKRKAVYELCVKHNVMILEDNPYGDLRFVGADIPSIKSLDTNGIVIYCGSFSKVLSPGLRVGYVCANNEIINKIVVCKQASDVHTNILAQEICYKFMTEYDFSAHLSMLRDLYRSKCNLMLDCIKKHLDPQIMHTTPEGGLFIWCTLPKDVDMMDYCKRAVENKVAVVPGSAFMVSEDIKTQSFRLNFSTPTDEQIVKGIEILSKVEI